MNSPTQWYWTASDVASEKDHWLGYLEQFPDYWTQGESFEDPKEHLKDLQGDLSNERIAEARRVAELEVS